MPLDLDPADRERLRNLLDHTYRDLMDRADIAAWERKPGLNKFWQDRAREAQVFREWIGEAS